MFKVTYTATHHHGRQYFRTLGEAIHKATYLKWLGYKDVKIVKD